MNVEELKKMDKPMITPNEAADVIGCNPQMLRIAAKTQVETGKKMLGFDVIRVGSRTFIPRLPFIRYIEGV